VEISPNTGRYHTVIRSRGGLVASFPHPDDGIAEIVGLAIPAGNDYYLDANGDNNRSGRAFTSAVSTFTKALSLMTSGRGDRLFVRPGDYAETEIDVNIADAQIIGLGADGAVGITPASGIPAMKVTANDVVLRNFRIEGVNDADYGLSIGDFDNGVLGVRVVGCLLRNGSHATKPAVLIHGAGDLYLVGNDIAWAGIGIEYKGGSEGYPSQIFQLGNHFHNLSVQHLAQRVTGAIDNGKVVNLNHEHNTHDLLEDGTSPTGVWIELDHTGTTGIVSDNKFAIATNGSSSFAIAAGVLWVANKTEAGVSTARPA
ncbi:hypothetical protein LCGC14_3048940, partial [marine sediment metagenome]